MSAYFSCWSERSCQGGVRHCTTPPTSSGTPAAHPARHRPPGCAACGQTSRRRTHDRPHAHQASPHKRHGGPLKQSAHTGALHSSWAQVAEGRGGRLLLHLTHNSGSAAASRWLARVPSTALPSTAPAWERPSPGACRKTNPSVSVRRVQRCREIHPPLSSAPLLLKRLPGFSWFLDDDGGAASATADASHSQANF